MKKLLVILIILGGGATIEAWYWSEARAQQVEYRTVAVKRGDLLATINATGTIEPEEVVDVGVQVAGEIQSFGKDPRDPAKPISYGSPVEQGTVLALLDSALFKARLAQTRANLDRAEADVQQAQAKLKQAERELERNRKLQSRGAGMVAQQELDTALANLETARAGLAVAQSSVAMANANLEEATVNLGYTTIRSPVKGVILDRRVNIGQTVVASLNAPSLFLIAKDLSRMEIWASVNETDIGSIRAGQPVRFTVGAFPHETFVGRVAQIRLNASMVQSVVTYTVVVEVDNASGKLLPYLTARLQFEVEKREGVLLVPNAALRWQPRMQQVVPDAREEFARSIRKRTPSPGEVPPRADAGPGHATEGMLWTAKGDFVRPVAVKVGLSDGVSTEVRGEDLEEGMQVVVGVIRQDDGGDTSSFLPHTRTEKSKR